MSAQRISLCVLMVGVVSLLGLNTASAVPLPVAAWSFDSDFTATQGGSTYNLTPSCHSGTTVATISSVQSKWGGGSAHFVASNNQYATGSSPFAGVGDTYTYSVWYYLDETAIPTNTVRQILESTNTNGNTGGSFPASFQCANVSGNDLARAYFENNAKSPAGSPVASPAVHQAWTNIIVTASWNGTTDTLTDYINGSSVGTADSLSLHLINDSAFLNVGVRRGTSDRFWNGYLDDLAVWNTVLSPADIATLQTESVALATATSTPEPGTVVLLVTGLFGLLAYAWRKRK